MINNLDDVLQISLSRKNERETERMANWNVTDMELIFDCIYFLAEKINFLEEELVRVEEALK